MLDLLHALERGLVERRHVVVRELLAARRRAAHDRAAGHLEVGALVVGLARDEEELLLEADVGLDARDRPAELAHQLLARLRDGRHRLEERRLLVERLAEPRDKHSRDEDGVAADEDRARRVDGGVAAGGVRRAHAAVEVRRAVGLALEERAAVEGVVEGASLRVEVEHRVVHLAGLAEAHHAGAERLEDVRDHRRACRNGRGE